MFHLYLVGIIRRLHKATNKIDKRYYEHACLQVEIFPNDSSHHLHLTILGYILRETAKCVVYIYIFIYIIHVKYKERTRKMQMQCKAMQRCSDSGTYTYTFQVSTLQTRPTGVHNPYTSHNINQSYRQMTLA